MAGKYMIKFSNYFQHKIVIKFSRNLIVTLPEYKDMSRSRKLSQQCHFVCSQTQSISTLKNIFRLMYLLCPIMLQSLKKILTADPDIKICTIAQLAQKMCFQKLNTDSFSLVIVSYHPHSGSCDISFHSFGPYWAKIAHLAKERNFSEVIFVYLVRPIIMLSFKNKSQQRF